MGADRPSVIWISHQLSRPRRRGVLSTQQGERDAQSGRYRHSATLCRPASAICKRQDQLEKRSIGFQSEQHPAGRLERHRSERRVLRQCMHVAELTIERASRVDGATAGHRIHQIDGLHRAADRVGDRQSEQGTLADRHFALGEHCIPHVGGGLPGERARRANQCLGARDLDLDHSSIAEPPYRPGWYLGRGQVHERVDRSAANPDGDGGRR